MPPLADTRMMPVGLPEENHVVGSPARAKQRRRRRTDDDRHSAADADALQLDRICSYATDSPSGEKNGFVRPPSVPRINRASSSSIERR